MAKTIKLADLIFKVSDDGSLKVFEGEAKKAGKATDKLSKSSQTADRNLKGASRQSSNSSKNFSKMAQGIQGGLVPAYATLAASMFAVSAVYRAFQNAADFSALQASQEAYAASTGVMMGSVSKSLQAASQGQLDLQTAGASAAIMIAKGFTTDQIDQVARASTAAAQSLGRSYEDTFNRIVQGTTKAEPELLDELGITLRLETATQKYADAIGKNRDELTTYERSQAVLNETLRQADENFGAVAGRVPVNAFNKLGTVMTDLTMAFQQFLTPIANFFANILGTNVLAAVAALGLFASAIISQVVPSTEEMITNIDEWSGKHTAAYDKAVADMQEYSAEQKKASMDVETGRAQGKEDLSRSAQTLGKTDSPVLKRAQRGTMVGPDKHNLKKALDSAEMQYKKHGKIVSGIFKGKDIQVVRSMKKSFTQMNMKTKTWSQSTKAVVKKVQLGFKVAAAGIKAGWQATMAGMGKATARFGAFAGKVMGKAGTIGIIIMVFQVIMGMVNNIDKIIIGSMTMIGKLIDGVIFMVEKLLNVLSSLPGPMGKLAEIAKNGLPEAGKFTEKFKEMGKSFVEEKGIGEFAKGRREGASANETMNNSLDATQEKLTAINAIIDASKDKPKSYLKGLEFQANALSTSGIAGEITRLRSMQTATKSEEAGGGALYSTEKLEEQEAKVRSLFTQLKKVVPGLEQFGDILNLDIKALMDFTTETGNAGNTLNEMKQVSESSLARRAEAAKGLASGFFDKELADLTKIQMQYASLTDASATLTTTQTAELAKILGVSEGTIAGSSISDILAVIQTKTLETRSLIDRTRKLSTDKLQNQLSGASFGSKKDEFTNQLKQEQKMRDFGLQQEGIAIKLLELREAGKGLDVTKTAANDVLIKQEELKLSIIQKQMKEYERSNTVVGQLNDTFQDGLDNMFKSIIDGTASAKDAFKQLAVVVIQEMQRILAVRMAASIIEAMTGMFMNSTFRDDGSTADALTYLPNITVPDIVPPARYGGTFGKKGYASGGIADGPQSGYNVLMHGREAIVPLPDGDKIPIQLTGKGQGPVNSVINVTVNNEGDTETSAEESTALGEAIQMAVTREISEQQRPGGLLSPI